MCKIIFDSRISLDGFFAGDNRSPDTIQQFLNAGLVDEFFIHIAPVFLGSGIRLFDGIDKDKYAMQLVEVIPSGLTTHLRYKLTKKDEQ